jgi:hypothetical protein
LLTKFVVNCFLKVHIGQINQCIGSSLKFVVNDQLIYFQNIKLITICAVCKRY